jgi:hypothetical protein
MEGALGGGRMTWVKIRDNGTVRGEGRITPRVIISLAVSTPSERITAEIRHVRVQLWCCPGHAQELIGETVVIGQSISPYGDMVVLQFATEHRMLRYLTERLASRTELELELRWDGQIVVTWDPTDDDRRYLSGSEPKPGEPTLVSIGNRTPDRLTVSRSDWFSNVLAPTQNQDYVFAEIAIPRGVANKQWTIVLEHLTDAEKAFTIGDYPGVFSKLRGAYEALPGYPKAIFGDLPEPRRREWDNLAKGIGDYLHFGRHVARDGDDAGRFAVTHLDAACALELAKVLLSHISRVLPTAQ